MNKVKVTLEGEYADVLKALNIPRALSMAFTSQLGIGGEVDWEIDQLGLKFKAEEVE